MAKSSLKLKILYGEGEADVLASQSVQIQKAGHQVTSAEGRKAIEQALKTDAFDLVILGPTLTRNDRHHLPYMVKKEHEGTRVLVMHSDGGRHPYVDRATDTGRSLESILETIATMMSQEKMSEEKSSGAPAANAGATKPQPTAKAIAAKAGSKA